MKKVLSLICGMFLIIAVSCSNIYDTLATIGGGLGSTGMNVFGLGKTEAKATSDAVNATLFGSTSSTEESSTPLFDGEKFNESLNKILEKKDGKWEAINFSGLKDSTNNGKVDLNVAINKVLNPFKLDDEDYSALVESIKEIKSDEARKEFANSMNEHFYADGKQPIDADVVGEAVESLKELLTSTVQPEISKFVEVVLDASVDIDAAGNGYLTKGGVLMISSIATIADRVLEKGCALTKVSRDEFDFNDLSQQESLELIKYAISDVKNLHTILLTTVGYDSEAGNAINGILTGAVAGKL